jgi:hypothetical protein
MSESDVRDESVWDAGWEGHEEAQLLRVARAPLRDRLRWLEEAHRLVLRLSARGRPAQEGPSSPAGLARD